MSATWEAQVIEELREKIAQHYSVSNTQEIPYGIKVCGKIVYAARKKSGVEMVYRITKYDNNSGHYEEEFDNPNEVLDYIKLK